MHCYANAIWTSVLHRDTETYEHRYTVHSSNRISWSWIHADSNLSSYFVELLNHFIFKDTFQQLTVCSYIDARLTCLDVCHGPLHPNMGCHFLYKFIIIIIIIVIIIIIITWCLYSVICPLYPYSLLQCRSIPNLWLYCITHEAAQT